MGKSAERRTAPYIRQYFIKESMLSAERIQELLYYDRPLMEQCFVCGAEFQRRGGKVYCNSCRGKKRKAHGLVHTALRNGSLVRLPCKVCGAIKTQAHHDDYDKPFDVDWLCSVHHPYADKLRHMREAK